MLEKIGLPAKPSLRGNNWVVDASHCQGCSSQFTFINRKHHCRRCGGLFCNSCTQQRMVLRGQGDSPVRICEPCKKLEEAARFEMRYGHKNRAGKGGSKPTVNHEDEVLNQILGSEGKVSLSSRSTLSSNRHSSGQQATSSASFSSSQEVTSHNDGEDVLRNLTRDQGVDVSEVVTITPEELRQQALEEKKKYRTLKAEGKPEEALRAFKRGKELERQAGALEISLRKSRRKASAASHSSEDVSKESSGESKVPPSKNKGNDDLAAELRELGWSDMDLRDPDKKPATMSLEGELSTLIGEASEKTNRGKEIHGVDKSQVIAHKRKALEFKREGKLAEAKEELKKAKVLEKQIEEQELLGDDGDSDEEFSSLLRSMNVDKHDLSSGYKDHSFDFGNVAGLTDNIGLDGNLEVTEEDMDDPEIAAALKSLGWMEETTHAEKTESQFAPTDSEALLSEIQSLKKEALYQKRTGNTGEALTLLKQAKLLEKDLDSSECKETNSVARSSVIGQDSSLSQSGGEPVNSANLDVRDVDEKDQSSKTTAKSKLMIQKELLGLKKRALALRREGKIDEAEEELKKGKVLEKQLEEMDSAPLVAQTNSRNKKIDTTASADAGDEEEVTDQDMSDPTYLSILQNLGWKDENDKDVRLRPSNEEESNAAQINVLADPSTPGIASRKSKVEIQRELLGLKRKSLALRRQGKAEEAEEVLKMAKVLETQLEEIEAPVYKEVPSEAKELTGSSSNKFSVEDSNSSFQLDSKSSTFEGSSGAGSVTLGRPDGVDVTNEHNSKSVWGNASESAGNSVPQDILVHKRRALALKREGKLAEAKEELRQAKLLEKRMEEDKSQKLSGKGMEEDKSQKLSGKGMEVNNSQPSTSSTDLLGSDVSSAGKKDISPDAGPKTLSSRERFKIQQESLSHKRQALKLRREGQTAEADAELELAKALEAQLEESGAHDSAKSSAAEPADGVTVEDFLDPQLLSALKALGIADANSSSPGLEISEQKEHVAAKIHKSAEERAQLEEQIKAERIKAVNFKRSGKQAEALDALRRAKLFEKKLNLLATQ